MSVSITLNGKQVRKDFDYEAFQKAVDDLRKAFGGEFVVVSILMPTGRAYSAGGGPHEIILQMLQGTITDVMANIKPEAHA